MEKLLFAFGIAIVLLIFVSGCLEPEPEPVCGNEVIEAGELCDGGSGACPETMVCLNDCKCGEPLPPAFPE